MEVHVFIKVACVFIVLFIGCGHFTESTQTIEMCRHICLNNCICNAKIQCETGKKIEIIQVEYRDTTLLLPCVTKCGWCCYTGLEINSEHKESIMQLCHDKQQCNLDSWNPHTKWKMKITYACNDKTTAAPSATTLTAVSTSDMQTTPTETSTKLTTHSSTGTTETTDSSSPRIEATFSSSSIAVTGSSHAPELTTDSDRIVKTKDKESAGFPLGAIIAIPVGIVVMMLLIVGIVCVVRRRSHGTQKGRKTNKSTLPMQDMTENDNDNSTPSGNREQQQEYHDQDYVDTTTHEGINTTDDDEYNTLNTHQAHVQIDPNYDHLPKDSHTTVDETYAHVNDSQTAVPDATYSHLQDSKSNASNNVKRNQNNSNNVHNHINTLSVEDSVYNNTETNSTKNPTSNLSQIRAEEDDYDHTDWNQGKSLKPIARSNGAIKTSDTNTLPEHADDEYAVVNKRSDNVESNDVHNYFVLEKHAY